MRRSFERSIVVWAAVVITVTVAVEALFGPAPETAFAEQVASAGNPAQVRLIAVENPVEEIIPTLDVPDDPGLAMVTSVGPETIANPGEMPNVIGAGLLLGLKLESPP